MKNIKHILLDLDGVISDNSDGITNGVAAVMRHIGLAVPEKSELLKFIGPPLSEAFEEYLGLSKDDALEAVKIYREYYRETGIFENVMYDGVPEMLASLKDDGYKLYLATSKPEEFARRICERFNIDGYFTYIGGATFDGKRGKKSDVIQYVLDTFQIHEDSAIMIGDRHHDVHGATACGLKCIGVLYGFGDKAELLEAGAVSLANRPYEICSIINKS